MNFQDLLQQLNTLDEHHQIEAKTSSQMGESLLETVCAFANEPGMGGGYILVGVAPTEDTFWPEGYHVVGVADPDQVQADIASQCATVFNRPIRPRIWSDVAENKSVIGVYVPEAQLSEKPIYFKNRGLPSGAYRRVGSTDQRCSEDDLLVFYQDQHAHTYDEHVIADATLDEIDPEAVAVYRRMREKANPNAEELLWDDKDLLHALGCMSENNGRFCPTAAGILLFGTGKALRRYFPMMRIDYIRVPGREWVSDPDKRFDTLELLGPLFRTLQRAQAAILDDFPKSFSLPPGQLNREDIPPIPDRVIREALVNAVMHRSYRVHGPVQIIRYENRLEFRNPGHSLKAPEKFGEPGSQTRNPKLAAALHDTNFAENKGSGLRVMREKMEAANLSPPYLESDRVGNQFIVILLFHHFVSQEDLDWLAHFSEANFTDEDVRALVFLREAGAINNSAYRDVNKGVDTLTASTRLRRLRDLGLLNMRGKSTATYYMPTPKLLEPLRRTARLVRPSEVLRVDAPESEARPPRQSEHPQGISQGVEPLSQGVEPLSQGVEPLSQVILTIPTELAELVRNLGERSSPKSLREVILGLCAWQPLRAETLARLLGRNQPYITRSYLTPMVREGVLAHTIPDQPYHPDQAYRTLVQENGR